MANHFTGLPDLGGTFSRLVPASRSLAFQFPSRPPNRVSPDLHPSTDNASRSTDQHLDTDIGQEMRDVELRYTSCLRCDGLSQSDRALYGVVVDMARAATHESGETSTESAARVRSIDNYVQNTVADSRVANQSLAEMEEDARIYRFHAHLGDFSGCLCKLLKEGEPSESLLARPWTTIVKALDTEDSRKITWEASNQHGRRPRTPYADAIGARVNVLISLGYNDLDLDIALFAVRTYARRCLVAHGASYALDKSNDRPALARYLENVEDTLVTALPASEIPMVVKYQRLLNFYRNSKIRLNGDTWVKAHPLPTQLPPTPVAESGPKDVKKPIDMLLEKIRQLQDELGQADVKMLKECENGLREELEALKKVFQNRVKGKEVKGKGKGK